MIADGAGVTKYLTKYIANIEPMSPVVEKVLRLDTSRSRSPNFPRFLYFVQNSIFGRTISSSESVVLLSGEHKMWSSSFSFKKLSLVGNENLKRQTNCELIPKKGIVYLYSKRFLISSHLLLDGISLEEIEPLSLLEFCSRFIV